MVDLNNQTNTNHPWFMDNSKKSGKNSSKNGCFLANVDRGEERKWRVKTQNEFKKNDEGKDKYSRWFQIKVSF